jgi:predicted amidohydrolase
MSGKGVIRVATCQFPVGAAVQENAGQVRRQIAEAAGQGADVVHFPECALSGYAGTDMQSWDAYDWRLLRTETEAVCDEARRLGVWLVAGSAHPLTGGRLPHNCLYVVDPQGRILDRYDKRFCTAGDLKFYSPGDHLTVFEVNGVVCGCAVCYDARFPELYRAYKKRGVQCLFHSFYNARAAGPGVLTVVMRPTLQCHAATNYVWISGANASARYQCWPSVLVQPDGRIVGRLARHRAGVMVNAVDTNQQFYDASAPFRDDAIRGVLHSGGLVDDPRSHDRTSL